jgi:hypothetical protein
MHCDDPACSGGDENVVLWASLLKGIQHDYNSLALTSSGSPVASYFNNSPGVDVGGDLGIQPGSFPDTAGTVGEYSSIALDVLEHPVASYYDRTNGDLKVLHCSDDQCSHVVDTDGDGCPDVKEVRLDLGSEQAGGKRSSKNPYDYVNPTHDGKNRIDDIEMVLGQYFIDSGHPNYNPDTDRTLVGPNLWNTGPPNGLQRVDDIVNQLNQYFHDCS